MFLMTPQAARTFAGVSKWAHRLTGLLEAGMCSDSRPSSFRLHYLRRLPSEGPALGGHLLSALDRRQLCEIGTWIRPLLEHEQAAEAAAIRSPYAAP